MTTISCTQSQDGTTNNQLSSSGSFPTCGPYGLSYLWLFCFNYALLVFCLFSTSWKARTFAGECSKGVPVVKKVVTESVEQVRSGGTSMEENVDVVMEVCSFVAGETGAHVSCLGRRDVRVSRSSEKRRRGRRKFLVYMQSRSLILICSLFLCS